MPNSNLWVFNWKGRGIHNWYILDWSIVTSQSWVCNMAMSLKLNMIYDSISKEVAYIYTMFIVRCCETLVEVAVKPRGSIAMGTCVLGWFHEFTRQDETMLFHAHPRYIIKYLPVCQFQAIIIIITGITISGSVLGLTCSCCNCCLKRLKEAYASMATGPRYRQLQGSNISINSRVFYGVQKTNEIITPLLCQSQPYIHSITRKLSKDVKHCSM